MKKLLDLITDEVTEAFVIAGYDGKYGKEILWEIIQIGIRKHKVQFWRESSYNVRWWMAWRKRMGRNV